MTILLINGPNLNRLGQRKIKIYGRLSLSEINQKIKLLAKKDKVKLIFFQSNHEGQLIDFLQDNCQKASGILINPGALTHYGYSLRDALIDTKLPIVEVHLSDPEKREAFRKVNVLAKIVIAKVAGLKEKSYFKGYQILVNHLHKKGKK